MEPLLCSTSMVTVSSSKIINRPTVCKAVIRLRDRREGAMFGWQRPRFLSSPKPGHGQGATQWLGQSETVLHSFLSPGVSPLQKNPHTGQLWGSKAFDVQFLWTGVVTTTWIHGY